MSHNGRYAVVGGPTDSISAPEVPSMYQGHSGRALASRPDGPPARNFGGNFVFRDRKRRFPASDFLQGRHLSASCRLISLGGAP